MVVVWALQPRRVLGSDLVDGKGVEQPERVPPDVGTFGGERGRDFLDISFAGRFLRHFGEPTEPPPLSPARAPVT